MDYRASIGDDEHPAGASPWGSSPPVSPRRNGSSYPYEAAAQDNGNGFAQDESNAGAFPRPDTADGGAASTTDYNPSHQSDASQPHDAETSQQQQQQQPHQHPHAQPKPQGQEQQQYTRRSTGPQYKLQAKITGLERTGRKDPILRFDVHVGVGTLQD